MTGVVSTVLQGVFPALGTLADIRFVREAMPGSPFSQIILSIKVVSIIYGLIISLLYFSLSLRDCSRLNTGRRNIYCSRDDNTSSTSMAGSLNRMMALFTPFVVALYVGLGIDRGSPIIRSGWGPSWVLLSLVSLTVNAVSSLSERRSYTAQSPDSEQEIATAWPPPSDGDKVLPRLTDRKLRHLNRKAQRQSGKPVLQVLSGDAYSNELEEESYYSDQIEKTRLKRRTSRRSANGGDPTSLLSSCCQRLGSAHIWYVGCALASALRLFLKIVLLLPSPEPLQVLLDVLIYGQTAGYHQPNGSAQISHKSVDTLPSETGQLAGDGHGPMEKDETRPKETSLSYASENTRPNSMPNPTRERTSAKPEDNQGAENISVNGGGDKNKTKNPRSTEKSDGTYSPLAKDPKHEQTPNAGLAARNTEPATVLSIRPPPSSQTPKSMNTTNTTYSGPKDAKRGSSILRNDVLYEIDGSADFNVRHHLVKVGKEQPQTPTHKKTSAPK